MPIRTFSPYISSRAGKNTFSQFYSHLIKTVKALEFDPFFNLYLFFVKSFCQALSPDNDKLKQGVQKCHKTIKDALSNANVFHAEGTETLFLILRKTTELRSSEIGRYKYQGRGGNDSGNVVGLHQILGMLKVYLYLICDLYANKLPFSYY